MPEPPQSAARRVLAAWPLFALIALVWVPIFANTILPLEDYAPHLARIFVWHELLHGRGFADMYSWRWIVVPNLGMDIPVLGLMEAGLPAETAGRIIAAVVAVLPATGVVALHRVSFGRWSPWPLLSFAFAFDPVFFAGYISFLLGLGLLVWTVAAWRMLAPAADWRAPALLAVAAPILFFCHLSAPLLLFGMVGGCGMIDLFHPAYVAHGAVRQPGFGMRAAKLILAVTLCLLPLGLLAFAPMLHTSGLVAAGVGLPPFRWRALNLFSFAFTYRPLVDVATLAVCAGIALYAVARRTVRIDAGLMLCAGGLLVIYFLLRDGWYGTADLPGRLPRVIAMLALAGSDVRPPGRRGREALVAVVLTLVAVRVIVVDLAWSSMNATFRPLLALLDQVPMGARIAPMLAYKGPMTYVTAYLGAVDNPEFPPTYTLPCYAAIRRHAFTGATFAIPTQNLVVRTPKYDAAPWPGWYNAGTGVPPAEQEDPFAQSRLEFFDYILLINPDYFPTKPPPAVQLLLSGQHFAFYAVRHAVGH